MTCSRATTLPAFRARISSTRYPFRTEDKYLPSIVPERMAKLLTTRSFADVAAEALYMWKGAKVAAALFLLAACAADEEQRKAQREEFAKAAAEAEAQIAQQDDARCKSYGRPGSPAYIDCRTSLKNDRADMKK